MLALCIGHIVIELKCIQNLDKHKCELDLGIHECLGSSNSLLSLRKLISVLKSKTCLPLKNYSLKEIFFQVEAVQGNLTYGVCFVDTSIGTFRVCHP